MTSSIFGHVYMLEETFRLSRKSTNKNNFISVIILRLTEYLFEYESISLISAGNAIVAFDIQRSTLKTFWIHKLRGANNIFEKNL